MNVHSTSEREAVMPETVLITGCSSGFGLLTALHFARQGARVVATLRDPGRAGALRQAKADERLDIDVVALDVLDPSTITAAVAHAETRAPIDVLINNAGIEVRGPIEECDDDLARRQFDTNVLGTLRVLRAVLPAMRARRRGTIVNVSSVAGVVARPYGGLYSASKHALEAISEALYYEVKPFGVRVVLVEPGQYATHLADNMLTAPSFTAASPYWQHSAGFDARVTTLAGGASADPQEVARIVYDAVHDPQPRLRYLAGTDAHLAVSTYRQLEFEHYEQAMRGAMDWWD
jgi:NAD(P)-dependent dehydrogenase (short-subunit alcohol dehydrogenase family)